MSKRLGGKDVEDTAGTHTFGHNLLTTEQIKKLSDYATHWAVVLHFENDDPDAPAHNFFPSVGLVNIFEQGKLCRGTLLAGFRTTRQPKRPVPACFFRTLDFLLQFLAAGNAYRAINDKEDLKGFPPAGWCRPPVVAAAEDAPAATAAALRGATPDDLARAPATDPIRLFYSSRSWCFVQSYHIAASTLRLRIGVQPEEMYQLYCDGALSEYSMMVGLTEANPAPNLWVPPCVMMPLGALLYMHGHGRPYLPISLLELREVRSYGILTLGPRKDAQPLTLPYGVWPVATEDEVPHEAPAPAAPEVVVPPGMEFWPPARSGGGPDGKAGAGGSGGSAAGSRQMSRAGSSAPLGSGSAAATSAAAPAAASGGASARAGGAGTAGPASSNGSTATAAALPPEPDPILNSANWIMPKPFDTPIPAAPAAADAGDGDGGGRAAAVATPVDDTTAAAAVPAVAAEAPAANALSALPPSPFLDIHNNGVQPTFETPALRLFLGDRCQTALSSNWWFIDSETKGIKGPYSPEQMMLSYAVGCRELHEETPVCGTDADVRLPMVPPPSAFQPLGSLLAALNDGACYATVTRADILSPLTHRFLGNRIRQPKPPAAAVSQVPLAVAAPVQAVAATPTVPVVVAVQQLQPQQPQTVVAAAAAGGPQAPQAPAPTVTALPTPVAVKVTAQPVLQAQPQAPPMQPQMQPQPQPQVPTAVVNATQMTTATVTPPGLAAGAPIFRPMVPLAHLAGAGALPRPVVLAPSTAATPAYVMPGTMMYMQQYGQPNVEPYTASPVLAQPVRGGAMMHPAAPQPQQQQQ